MSGGIDRVLRKVRALRKLATSTNVHEAQAAAAQADALIQKHRLEEAQLDAGTDAEAAVADASEPVDVEHGTRRVVWRSLLLTVIAKHYGCASYCAYGRRVEGRVVGRAGDVALVRFMFAWVVSEIARLASAATRGRSARLAFCRGAVDGFRVALHRAKQRAIAEHYARSGTMSAAMVLADRAVAAEQELSRLFPSIRIARESDVRDVDAYRDGRRAGEALRPDAAALPGEARPQLGAAS